jgi:hypothetical protein
MTYEDLKPYFTGDRHHYYYDKSIKRCKAFAPHADGVFPCDLIECRRPNEPMEVKDYRKEIWVPKTKPTFSRILNSLGKIRRSPDWAIAYPKDLQSKFARIREGETLQDYCEKKFPYFESVTNWLFSVCLKPYLTDPNGVILIWPLSTVEPTDFLEPYPVIFECCDVKKFEENDNAVLNDPAGCYYMTKRGNKMVEEKGKAHYVVDAVFIQRYEQIDNKGNYNLVLEYEHGLGYMPCFKLGGVICEAQGSNYLYESRISGILPEMDEAVREYSDLQAAKVLHVYPEKWQYTSHECTTCKGTGVRPNPNWQQGCDHSIPVQIECGKCVNGYVSAGPYAIQLVKPADMGKQQLPTPPAGYVEKDVEIVKLMEDSVRQHIYDGLAAINFQELAETPMNESGVAKAVDRDEQNNTVHAIAEDLVKIMDRAYAIIADYRYKGTYSFEEIGEMLPSIAVPEKFDLFSIANLQNDLKAAKDNKLNPVIQNAMEVDYAGKLFNADPTIRDLVALTIKLDPLPSISEDEKMSRLSNKGILPESYIISSNINEFVQRAIDEDEGFAEKPLKDQKAVMLKYAQEILGKLDIAKQIIDQQVNEFQEDDSGENDKGGNDSGANDDLDQIGKLPLAIQQLSLAATRATESGDQALARRLHKKVDELLKSVGV